MFMDAFRLSWTVALKDLRIYCRDKVGLALGFLLPVGLVAIMASVFGFLGGDDDGGMPKLSLRVADLDRTDASRRFVEALAVTGLAEASLEESAGKPWTRESLLEGIRHSRFPLGVVIEAGFEKRIEAGTPSGIEIVRDPAKEMEFQLASQAMMPALMTATSGKLARSMVTRGLRELQSEGVLGNTQTSLLDIAASTFFDAFERAIEWNKADSRKSETKPAKDTGKKKDAGVSGITGMGSFMGLKETVVGAETSDKAQAQRAAMLAQAVAGTAVMMLLFGLSACGRTLLDERDAGTLRRLLVTPAPRGAIIAGKFLMTFVIGLGQLAVMFAFGAVAFGLPVMRHLHGVVLVSAATVAASTGFGVLLATIGRSSKQIDGIATLVILLMSATGGSWFPLFIMPKWMQTVGHFTLNAWAMDGYMGVLAHRSPLSEILLPVGVLVAVAVVECSLAVIFFNRRFAATDRG